MMKNKHNEAWIGTDQLQNTPEYQKATNEEFTQLPIVDDLNEEGALQTEASRRDFLKYLGFGLGAATIAAGCEIPVKRAIPYVVKPDSIVPGVATYFASTFVQGGDYCSILVKTREGRPIKVEGNSLSGVTMGGTSARVQASVLGLYDTSRVTGPYKIADGEVQRPAKGQNGPGWAAIDKEIMDKLNAGSRIRIVANTLMSPTFQKALDEFCAKFTNAKLVMYDPVSSSALLQANEESFGQAVVPNYHFNRAKTIVSFDADFLGTWISPVEYAAQYVAGRKVDDVNKAAGMSRHYHVESHMSLTGSNADNRILVKPSEQGAAIVALYNEVAGMTGGQRVNGPKLNAEAAAKFKKVAQDLVASKGQSLVVAGSNNVGEQVLVNGINEMLGNYGRTLDFDNPSMQRKGLDGNIQQLVKDMNAGSVDAVFFLGDANPAFDIPNADQFQTGLAKVGLKVAMGTVPNETTLLCNYTAPDNHFLESWGDAQPKANSYSLIQPTISPLFNTRHAGESFLTWAESANLDKESDQPYYEYLKATWEANMFPLQSEFQSFLGFWDSVKHDGVFELPTQQTPVAFAGNLSAAASKVRKPATSNLEISFYETVNMGAGQYGNNPWLLEMPDPVNRCSWGNYLAIPVGYEGGNSFTALNDLNNNESYGQADIVEVDVNGGKQNVTVVRQFGQMPGTVSLAVGYGREVTGYVGKAIGNRVGINTYPWLSLDANGNTQYYATSTTVSEAIDVEKEFACVQYHHSMGLKGIDPDSNEEINVDEKTVMTIGAGYQGGIVNRSIIYQGNVAEIKDLVHHIEEKREEAAKLNASTLYPYEEYKENVYSQGHHWGMHIDLTSCIGCSACQVACTAENNVPVVGKREIARHHDMHWLRIDRYFYGDFENPNTVYQPMMCQHCDNAPCENVCPVAATNHSSEGLNQMTYNRCIGTRYCANNCPYKVRRLNWLDYTKADLFGYNEVFLADEEVPYGADNLTRMVLNPDVTVRSRGVIEKCSFCVQRIQEGKLTAKREQRSLVDADVKTACQTACPTGAITFGDQNDKKGSLFQRLENPLNYLVLEEVNTQSSVFYTAKVNNKNEGLEA